MEGTQDVTTKAGPPPRREGCAWTLSKVGPPSNSHNDYGGANSPPISPPRGCPPRWWGSPSRQGSPPRLGVTMQQWGSTPLSSYQQRLTTTAGSPETGGHHQGGEAKAGDHHQRQVTKFTTQAGDHQGRVSYQQDWGHHQDQSKTPEKFTTKYQPQINEHINSYI